MEALDIGQAITPISFQRCKDITVRLKFFICFLVYRDMTEI